eukprot:scaffold178197_cov23-Tisochrysis_lutea.AAC.1
MLKRMQDLAQDGLTQTGSHGKRKRRDSNSRRDNGKEKLKCCEQLALNILHRACVGLLTITLKTAGFAIHSSRPISAVMQHLDDYARKLQSTCHCKRLAGYVRQCRAPIAAGQFHKPCTTLTRSYPRHCLLARYRKDGTQTPWFWR